MARFSARSHPIGDLYDELEALRRFGDNAVVRRMLTLVYERMRGDVATREAACRPDVNGECRPDRCVTFSVHDGIHETRQDDRRRSVFLDPEEAFLANYSDFLEGRLDVLEFRDPGFGRDLASMEERAREVLRERVPTVVVNRYMAKSDAEVVNALRVLADRIESGESDRMAATIGNDRVRISAMGGETCRHLRTEVRGSRYIDNGHTHQVLYAEILECKANDGCCGNAAYTKVGSTRWETDWQDGSSSTPPPELPPPYPEGQAWNNQLPILENTAGATLSSDYGWRQLNGQPNFHGGIDVAAPVGTGVRSNVAGTVVYAPRTTWDNSGVVIRAGDRTYTYWHITPLNGIQQGTPVNVGEPIGRIRDGGPPHVHHAIHEPPNGDYSQRNDGNSINPLP